MKRRMSRRRYLQLLAAAMGELGLAALSGCVPAVGSADGSTESRGYLPLVSKASETPVATPTGTATGAPAATATTAPTPAPTTPPGVTPTASATPHSPPTGARVVHVRDENATSWDFSTGWYGDYVNQEVVNAMVDEGVRQLTGQQSVSEAWHVLVPEYVPGRGIAIKVNLNNASWANAENNVIDAIMEPVNALVRSLVLSGVRENDVWVYDASRPIPDRFRLRCAYPGVRFFDNGAYAESAGFSRTHPDAKVIFGHSSLTDRHITDVLVEATYLINMPIVKDHGISNVTLGFKNHFGSIDTIVRAGEDNLHSYISPGDPHYSSRYSPFLDLYQNAHIRTKTVLTVGDGLYAAVGNTNVAPSRWSTFGDAAPNSLFFATDCVAVDCVMLDMLDAEPTYHPRPAGTDDYLVLAAEAGLGTYERGDFWGVGYGEITYVRMDL